MQHSRIRRCRKTEAHGFTLIEVLVVLAILGILAAGATVALRPVRERSLLSRSGGALINLIARASANAIRDGRPAILRFDTERRTIAIDGTSTRVLLDPSVTLILTTAREVGTGADQAILFLPDGTGSGGRLRLEIVGSSAGARTLRVSWLTGIAVDER